ncbi:hypothetical protein BJX76DRAFT_263720 [Aspergillus varians]
MNVVHMQAAVIKLRTVTVLHQQLQVQAKQEAVCLDGTYGPRDLSAMRDWNHGLIVIAILSTSPRLALCSRRINSIVLAAEEGGSNEGNQMPTGTIGFAQDRLIRPLEAIRWLRLSRELSPQSDDGSPVSTYSAVRGSASYCQAPPTMRLGIIAKTRHRRH